MGMQTRQCTTNAWIHRSPFLSPENSQVTRGKFIDRSLHPTLKEKEVARLLDMVPVKKGFQTFLQDWKRFLTAAVWLQLLTFPRVGENMGYPGFGWVNKNEWFPVLWSGYFGPLERKARDKDLISCANGKEPCLFVYLVRCLTKQDNKQISQQRIRSWFVLTRDISNIE